MSLVLLVSDHFPPYLVFPLFGNSSTPKLSKTQPLQPQPERDSGLHPVCSVCHLLLLFHEQTNKSCREHLNFVPEVHSENSLPSEFLPEEQMVNFHHLLGNLQGFISSSFLQFPDGILLLCERL